MNNTTADQRFDKLGLNLPPAPKPLGVYKPFLQVGNLVYVSGHGTVKEDGTLIIGRVGKDLTMDEGKLAARQVGLAILATLKKNLGSFNRIKRVIKVLGMVNCVPSFKERKIRFYAWITNESKRKPHSAWGGIFTLSDSILN